MNVEIKFTYLDTGLSLCFVCNLGAIRGRFRRVFGSVVRGVVSPLKDVRAKNFYNTDFFHTLATVR